MDGDDDEGEGAMPKQLEKLSKNRRYRMVGKIFALKIRAWPSSSWWVRDEVAEEPPAGRLSRAEVLLPAETTISAPLPQEWA